MSDTDATTFKRGQLPPRNPDIEFYMIQHIWMENDRNFADLLLPVTTKFEDTDISTDDENGAYCVVFYEENAISPRGEAVSDMEVVKHVAKRLDDLYGTEENFKDIYMRYTENDRSDDEWIKLGFESNSASEHMTYEEFKEVQSYVVPTRENWQDEVVVVRTKSGNFVDVGDISTRAKGITGVDEAPYYMVQDGAAGSIYLSMMAFPKILEWADNDIDHVILRHDVNYKDTRIQKFHEESVTRYSFC